MNALMPDPKLPLNPLRRAGRIKKALEYGLVIVIVVLVASIFTPITFLNRNKYRAEIRDLYERLLPGRLG